MDGTERRFAAMLSGAHGMDHFLKRVFPPLVPIWAVAFGFPLWKLGLLLGARSFGSAVGQAPVGHLADRYDRRLMLPAGIALIGVSFVVLAALPGLDLLRFRVAVAGTSVSGRFVGMVVAMVASGLGSSTLHPTGYPLISRNVRDEHTGKALGMWGSARAFGDGAAPAAVGLALLAVGWQPILVGFGVVGVVYAASLFLALDPFDTRPASVSTEAGATEADAGADSTDRRLYVYPMLVVFVAFVLQLVATAGANVFLPTFITSEYGYSFAVAGFAVTPASTASFYYSALLVTAGVVQLGTGGLVDRYDHRTVLLGFLVTGALTLLAFATVTFSPPVLFSVLLLLGASLWGLNPARDAIVSDIAPPDREGRTFGYLWTGGLLLSSTAPALVGYVGEVASLREAFALLAGFVLLSAVPIALLHSDRVYIEDRSTDAAPSD